MEKTSDVVVEKYEERFIRRLGEIAILLHLAKSPDGSHAYEMRSKASEILFERRKHGLEFLSDLLENICKLKDFILISKVDSSTYKEKRTEILEKLEHFPILKYNIRIQKMMKEDYKAGSEDIEYIEDIIRSLEEAIEETKEQATIWTNISGIYPAIETLEKNGLIILDREDPEGGRLKKIYKITEIGKESLFRVMASMLDISAFIMETEAKQFFTEGRGISSSRFIPFQKLFKKLTEDLSPDFRKRFYLFRGRPHGQPFLKMMMNQGIATPRLNVLLHHPEMLKEHLESLETEDEKKMTKSYLKIELEKQIEMINKLMEEL